MRRSHFPFVVISGLPGSGKTTVARALAQSMTLPLFDKDEILERLFDSKGTGDAIWRRRLSRESDAILQAAVSSSAGAIVSSFWHAAGMPSDSGTPTGWLTGLSGTIVNVHCECPPEVAAGRFIRRTRHAGHLDEARTAADVRASIHALVPCGPLAIGEQVVVDTTKALVAVSLMQDVQAALRRAELAAPSRPLELRRQSAPGRLCRQPGRFEGPPYVGSGVVAARLLQRTGIRGERVHTENGGTRDLKQ